MFKRKTVETKLHVEKGRTASFGAGQMKLTCIRGIVWVTWPGSDDVILRDGDELSVRSDGVFCVTAFSGAFIHVRSRKVLPCIKDIPRLAVSKTAAAFISYLKDEEHRSAFGDSVHSITR